MERKWSRVIFILILIGANIVFDQVSKSLVRQHVKENEIIQIIGSHFVLTRCENSGAFLSSGEDMHSVTKSIIIKVIPAIGLALALLYVLLINDLTFVKYVGFSFVIGGGVGNLFDRLNYGSVTDFLHIDFLMFKMGIFNLADVSILIGIISLISSRLVQNYSSEDSFNSEVVA